MYKHNSFQTPLELEDGLKATLRLRADSCEYVATELRIETLELMLKQTEYEIAVLAKLLIEERESNETPPSD